MLGGDGGLFVPRWVPPTFLLGVALLIPWTAWLFASLPRHHNSNHWALTWAGFDAALAISLAVTAGLIIRRSALAEITATVTATLLLCDAWFDVLTARGTEELLPAVAEALIVELPLAALCFWIARNVDRALEGARPYLERARLDRPETDPLELRGRRRILGSPDTRDA